MRGNATGLTPCEVFYRVRSRLWALTVAAIFLSRVAVAGGPAYVAGASYFAPSVKGMPLTWPQGQLNYYTDQGDLSPVLPSAQADAFVADAFAHWTAIPTAAISATNLGHLAENVSGANVVVNPDGSLSIPSDILPSAIAQPIAVVYDSDGTVTEALLGAGAGDPAYCFSNSVFGGVDNFGSDAHFLHALIILNGNCGQNATQLPDLRYRLVRLIGRILGLDWSQANLNVVTHSALPIAADYDGFPLMHSTDPISCVPISTCYSNADQLKMDDRVALGRLYPITPQNQASFPGKLLFFENRIRIQGTVRFSASGSATQAMQGVNVVARWVDPATGQASRAYVATSVSGFRFHGNAGNLVTGFADGSGKRFDRFGSDDGSLEGTFDLAGLEIPNGAFSAQYQLSVEPLDALWSQGVGPYGVDEVAPSGTFAPVLLTITQSGSVQRDIVMQASANYPVDAFKPTSYGAPATLPTTGDWFGTLTGYGTADFFSFPAQANRTLSLEVTALNESAASSEAKAMPVVGMWAMADPGTTPAPGATSSSFNTALFGESRLDATLAQSTTFRAGIADQRGDGRPDYRYHARLFYADTLSPTRISAGGGAALTIRGYGFRANTSVSIGNTVLKSRFVSANQLTATAPALADGTPTLSLADPATGASSTMMGALTVGASPGDIIRLISGANPATPVGGQAPNPMVIAVFAGDGVTPVAGASVFFSASPSLDFSVCGGAPTCTVLTDANGQASSYMSVLTAAIMTVTAQLAPGSYNPPQQVQTTLVGIASSLDLTVSAPNFFVALGSTLDLQLQVRALSNGTPIAGQAIKYFLSKGTATFGNATATTGSDGFAATTLHIAALSGDIQVSVCAEPGDQPCQSYYVTAVPASALQLRLISGNNQSINNGQTFQPVVVQLTDSSSPPLPVQGAGIIFATQVLKGAPMWPTRLIGQDVVTHQSMPLLTASSVSVTSDANGMASVTPSVGLKTGNLQLSGTASASGVAVAYQLQSTP